MRASQGRRQGVERRRGSWSRAARPTSGPPGCPASLDGELQGLQQRLASHRG